MDATHTDVNIKMGHCISVYLIRKEELRGEKIDSVIGVDRKSNIKFTELNCGILAATEIPDIRDFGKDKTIAKIETDYFGGMGHQEAKLYINNKKDYDAHDEFREDKKYKDAPINDVLRMMGIKAKDGMDEFDTIGLGNYRGNDDFE